MSASYKNYIMMLQMLNQNISNIDIRKSINEAFSTLIDAEDKIKSDSETATATSEVETESNEMALEAKRAFIEKCSESLKGLNSAELYSMGEKIAMLYLYMKKTDEKVSDEAIARIHPIGTSSFKDILGSEEYETFMNGWQNIIDEKQPSELTMARIRNEVEVTNEKQKKMKEESDKRFALNIRKKVTASQAALIAKKKLEKAGMVFEEGEGVTFIKRPPPPAVESPAAENIVVDEAPTNATSTSGGVAETKDD